MLSKKLQLSVKKRMEALGNQLKHLLKLIEADEDSSYPEIIDQLAAIKYELEEINKLVLKDYLQACFNLSLESENIEELSNQLINAIYKVIKK